MDNFRTKFDEAFGGIAKRFKFSVSELAETEILLRKDNFALIVYLDRDGVGVNYLRRNYQSDEVIQYPLGHLLHLLKREWVPSTKEGRTESELEAYALTLERSASDILNGDDTWLNQIKTLPFPVPSPTRELIGL